MVVACFIKCQRVMSLMDTNAEKSDIERVIRSWERAIQRGDMEGILANHSESVLMFDVPEPLQSEGLDAYRKTWELFFRYGAPDREVFVLEDGASHMHAFSLHGGANHE